MSAETRWWAIDLLLVVLLAEIAGAAIYFGAPAAVRLPSALLLVLVLPGYALTAVLFPARTPQGVELAGLDDDSGGLLNPLPADYELGRIERLILSVTLSLAIVPGVAAVANFTPAGISLVPVLGGVLVVTVVLAIVAFIRRLRLPPERRFALAPLSFAVVPRPFADPGRLDPFSHRVGTYNLVAVAGLVLVLSSVAIALAVPQTSPGFTEFYVVTDDATGVEGDPHPTDFTVGESRPVTLGIANHEHREVGYSIVVAVQGPDGGPIELIGSADTTVDDGVTRELTVSVEPRTTGDSRRLLFLLYLDESPSEPTVDSAYRVLDLSIGVTDSGEAVGG